MFSCLLCLLSLCAMSSSEVRAAILTVDGDTGAWNFELEFGDDFVASAPPNNQVIQWGDGDLVPFVNFDFNASYGPDFTGGDPNFSGSAQANLLTKGNELTGFQMKGPWVWDVTIVFFEITMAPNFQAGFTRPKNDTFATTIGASVDPLTVHFTPIPEPSTILLAGLATASLLWYRKLRSKAAQ